jgi:uncharacterized membrane protein
MSSAAPRAQEGPGPVVRRGSALGWWWTPLRVAVGLTVLVCVLGYAQKAPCLVESRSPHYQLTRLCYTDTYVLYSARHLDARTDAEGNVIGNVSVPYRDTPVEYPPVIGGLMWAAAEVTSLLHGDRPDPSGSHASTFFDVTALGLAAAALLSTFTVAQLAGRRRRWDAVMVAASPALLMYAYTNWDLAAVALTGLGLWAWSRGSPTWAGLALGLGVATKLYPLFVLLGLLMLCARERQWRAGIRALAGTAAGVVAAYIPAIVLSYQTPTAVLDTAFLFPGRCLASHPLRGWQWFEARSQLRGAGWGSIWLLIKHLFARTSIGHAVTASPGCGTTPDVLNLATAATIAVMVVGIAVLVVRAQRRPRVGQVAFLLTAGFILLNKIDSPQYVLWLVPLAVLARPKWASLLTWQVAEVALGAVNLYAYATRYPFRGTPIHVYLAILAVRDIILAAIMTLVVREILDPRRDIVRADRTDDPAGGVLNSPRRPPASA